jgi:hypothetical protein
VASPAWACRTHIPRVRCERSRDAGFDAPGRQRRRGGWSARTLRRCGGTSCTRRGVWAYLETAPQAVKRRGALGGKHASAGTLSAAMEAPAVRAAKAALFTTGTHTEICRRLYRYPPSRTRSNPEGQAYPPTPRADGSRCMYKGDLARSQLFRNGGRLQEWRWVHMLRLPSTRRAPSLRRLWGLDTQPTQWWVASCGLPSQVVDERKGSGENTGTV